MAILYDYKVSNGINNMQEDERLLNYAIDNSLSEPILRLYGWSPACVSLGRNQNDLSINKNFCSENNIDIVRRLTGGRALLHDDELTYSFVCPVKFLNASESIISSYKEISGALIEGFKLIDIKTAFPEIKKATSKFDYCMSISTGADLSYENKKIAGSAQFRKQGYILQHGSILMNYNPKTIEIIFNEKIQSDSITTINEINPHLSIIDVKNALIEGFSRYFDTTKWIYKSIGLARSL